ncbi:EAL domain-containing response regulator [Candidatus Berkiella cookevillensis]|uniref:EAL domain-containing response regulator n=1 Tax=Candidatus Berkiella cookevillensis TaxID=437022 RepID=A0A0Q9YA50_9GAMM|nr:EAL domain-containing response regulator [Candidatus Berkiella cookevillensis]MCS5707389.1 EAL domain-containing response regulator [Candidatus Berkiella cookevillensis]
MNNNTVLIIDDDPDVSALLADIAKSSGYDSFITNQIEDAKQYTLSSPPTLIILDLGIPSHDGIEFLRSFSEIECKVPIIIVSGHDEKIRSTAFNLGLNYQLNMLGHYPKPLPIQALIEILEHIKSASIQPNNDTLEKAIENKALVLHYQPMICLKSSKIINLETLVRWMVNPEKIIFPDQFIPLAESSGLIVPLTRLIVEMAFQQYARSLNLWNINISINLSASNLDDLNLTDEIIALANQYKINPGNVCFEVTETAVMSQPQIAMDILTRLRLKGFQISLDDFGTGYSSFIELHRLPFSEMKIDKSFVMKLSRDTQAQKITKSIIELAHSLELNVVAEGVEDKETFEHLKTLNCDIAQGYFISKPLPADTLLQWFQHNCDDKLHCKWV